MDEGIQTISSTDTVPVDTWLRRRPTAIGATGRFKIRQLLSLRNPDQNEAGFGFGEGSPEATSASILGKPRVPPTPAPHGGPLKIPAHNVRWGA